MSARKKQPARKRPTTRAGRAALKRAGSTADVLAGEAEVNVDGLVADLKAATERAINAERELAAAEQACTELRKLYVAKRPTNDFHMEGGERRPGLAPVGRVLTQEQVDDAIAARRRESAHNDLVSESVVREFTGYAGSDRTKAPSFAFDGAITEHEGRTYRAMAAPAESRGMIESATVNINEAMAELHGITCLIEQVADKHLGTRPENESGKGANGVHPNGSIYALLHATGDLSRRIDTLREQAQRLTAL